MAYELATMKAVRAAFWRECGDFPNVSRRKIRSYTGDGKMHDTDTRVTFCDWLDAACREGRLSESLAYRATLD